MKNQIKSIVITSTLLLSVIQSYGGLDWSYGVLSNPDDMKRTASAVAYATNGNIFVAGSEETTTGDMLIVTKKFSSTGALLASITNTYLSAAGTTSNDYVKSITLDGNGNVYVLGSQFAGTNSRGQDVVVIKYSSLLVQQWKKLIYNSSIPTSAYADDPCKLLINAANDIFVSGTWATNLPGFTEEIFAQCYTSAGTLVYSQEVPQLPGLAIKKANDMCLDNNSNITVCAPTTDNTTILYARFSSNGSLVWRKFYYSPANYTYVGNPEMESSITGSLFLASSLDRLPSANNHYARHMIVSFNTSGNLIWQSLSTELNRTAAGIALRMDAANNIYTGSDFAAATGVMSSNHRIYKFNSSGTQQWSYVSPETSQSFSFETFSSTSLFILFKKSSPVNPLLRKLNAATGAILWNEDMPFGGVPGYYHSQLDLAAIAINSNTSEVAFCGNLIASILVPTYTKEDRWHVRKYGATSPRLSSTETNTDNAFDENSFTVFPNPVDQSAIISWKAEENKSSTIRIVDATGKEILKKDITSEQTELDVSKLENGVYFVQLTSGQNTQTKKIIIRH